MNPSHFDHLRGALDRARQHVERRRAELARVDQSGDGRGPFMALERARLVEDLRKAELDAAWAEIALADATSPMEVL